MACKHFVPCLTFSIFVISQVYYSEKTAEVTLDSVNGKCEVQGQAFSEDVSQHESFNHVFFCTCIFDPKKGTIKQVSSKHQKRR